MEKKISYLNRNYEDYRNALIEFAKTYYPDLANSFDDASVGSWFVDLNAAIADELSYHIDRVFQETNINSANKASSIYALARNNGVKIPGPKGAMCEVKFSCNLLPSDKSGGTAREPDWTYAPLIKRGTKVASANQTFELLTDVDFANPFNSEGVSDRTFVPIKNTNGVTIGYKVTKLAVVVGGESKIYKKVVTSEDVKPFMEVLIPSENVMNVESVIVKDGNVFQSNPTMGEFFMNEETLEKFQGTTRFFEVNSLIEQERWGEVNVAGKPETYWYNSGNVPVCAITKGEWKPVRHKFITEYTDNGYLKVIFGSGLEDLDSVNIDGASSFSKYQISKTLLNDSLGVLPKRDTTIFILYRVGGGKANNVAKGAINQITFLNAEIGNTNTHPDPSIITQIKNSLKVENTIPSVSGKDMPTVDELRYMIKYSNGAQDRCVTVKDYISRVLSMPSKYGTPFRVSGVEMNNKVMLYVLGIDYEGHLQTLLPSLLVKNMKDYLSNYRSINDFVEIKPGRIINLGFEIDVFIDKEYNKSDVVTNIINTVKNYLDINKQQMGDDIFVGDIEKEIGKIDGVLSLIDLRVYNICGNNVKGRNYSQTQIPQLIDMGNGVCENTDENSNGEGYLKVDLEASDKVLISEGDCMFEIKYPEYDIVCRCKER